MKSVMEICEQHFKYVTTDEDFTVVIDNVGVLLFTTSTADLTEEAKEIVSDLDAGIFEIYYVGKDQPGMEVTGCIKPHDFDKWCSNYIENVEAVYTQSDFLEMRACYEGYGRTMPNFLAAYHVPDDVFIQIMNGSDWTVQKLTRLGLDITVARDVLAVLEAREKNNDYEFTALNRCLNSFMRKKVMASMVCNIFAIVVLLIFMKGYASMIFSMVGAFFALVAHRAEDSWFASLAVFVSILVFLSAFTICYGQDVANAFIGLIQSRY